MYNNPYYTAFNPYAMAQHTPTPALQPQQIIQVNGKASVDTIQLAPNSSLLAMDTTAPIVWMCVSDGVGKVSATAYDITVHKDKPPIDVEDIEQRISRVEKIVAEWKESINDKSNVDSINSKPNGSKYQQSQTVNA